jgi:septal ring factor EnvC (AmiA/AmiB activator)
VAELRDALAEVEAARDRLQEQAEDRTLEEELGAARARVEDLAAEMTRTGVELADAQDEVERIATARAELEDALAQSESELARAHDELADARALVAREEEDVGDLGERDDERLAELFNAARRAYTEKWASDSGAAARWRAIALAAVEEAMRRPSFGSDDDDAGEGGIVDRVRRRRRQRLLAPLAEARAEALEADGAEAEPSS